MSPEHCVTHVSGMDSLILAAPEGIEPPTPSLGLKKNRLKNF